MSSCVVLYRNEYTVSQKAVPFTRAGLLDAGCQRWLMNIAIPLPMLSTIKALPDSDSTEVAAAARANKQQRGNPAVLTLAPLSSTWLKICPVW